MLAFTPTIPGMGDRIEAYLGFIPSMLSEHDPRSARDQLHANYQHGGGWSKFEGFTLLPNGNIQFPEDPPRQLLAEAKLRNETIRVYDGAWVMILQEDGTYEISRMD